MSYVEEGRLTAISRLQDGVTTPLFRYGYAFDGGRRWRHDVQNNVRDSYVCGVQCGAGELLTFRSTDGGATWNVLERRLDKAPVVNGSPFLAATGSGTQRIGSESALTDALGVLRGGSYGPGLHSVLNPLRGDAGVEETLRQLQKTSGRFGSAFRVGDNYSHAQLLTPQVLGFSPNFHQDACLKALDRCLDRVDKLKNACLARAGRGVSGEIRKCRLLIKPKLIGLCIAAVLAAWGVRVGACHARYAPRYAKCQAEFERCRARQQRP